MPEISAYYSVYAGTMAEGKMPDTVEVDGHTVPVADVVATLDADQLADLVGRSLDTKVYVSVCHQCSSRVNDPQVGEMVSFSVDGVRYDRTAEGGWEKA